MGRDVIWLSHHREHQHDRCVEVSGYLVCRRCLALYPLLLVVAVGFAVLGPVGSPWMSALIWLGPVPATVDYVLLGLGRARYNARRVVVLTALAALGLGAALSYHLVSPFDRRFVVPALAFSSVWLLAALAGDSGGLRRTRA